MLVFRKFVVPALASAMLLLAFAPNPACGQTEDVPVPSRVVARVDDTQLVKLPGNTHPMARAQYDQGLVDPGKQLERIVLVLKRSPEQEQALAAFNEAQYDPKSPEFHHWLHAEEFGQLYGPSDADIAAVTGWLQNHGFQIDEVSKGRVNLQFTGTVAQVQEAFHVEMHHYKVAGIDHIANDRDPQIPEALAPVVTGIASLHDFFPNHQSVLGRYVTKNLKTGKVTPVDEESSSRPRPQFAFPDPNVGDIQNEDIGPYDFAAMYNLTPLWTAGVTGKGVSIAIAAETDINMADVATFRKTFGLSKFTGTAKMVINGTDPGTVAGAVVENTLDTEWSGASAPDADILVVATKTTATSSGGLLSIEYIVDKEVAPVTSASYGTCEAGLGSAGNKNLNATYQQGSTEGISMFESAGDQGSTGCDNSDATTFPAPAQNGLQVNGFASPPYITGVGGTDIVWQEDAYSKYWHANDANNASAIGYIPEVPWNSTCTSSYLLTYVYTGQTSSEELCNNAYADGLDQLIAVVGGSGGKSSCLDYTGSLSTCSGAYAKPSWQTGVGVPKDSVRDVPDVSLFASGGLPEGNGGSAYLICVSSSSPNDSCTYSGDDIVYQEVGGTSVSSPAMAGIMAMVVQQLKGASQGLANPVFYQLAATETLADCNSNTVANGNDCIFYDTTTGTNAMPCTTGSLNCVTKTSGDTFGIVTGYTTTTGYDQATGLGSVNAYNLVNKWPTTAAPAVKLSATSVTFASTTVGSTTAAQTVTLTNSGTATLDITSIAVGGTDATSFLISAKTCTTTLAAAASCTFSVEFKPAATGALTGDIAITDNAAASPQKVTLAGTGAAAAAPAVSLSATSLTFASTTVGSTTTAQTVTLKNTGTATLDITSIAVGGTDETSFLIPAKTCTTTLAAAASCTFSVEFKPAATGALTGDIAITDNATGSPQKVTLAGTGAAASTGLTLSPTSLTFASTAAGNTSEAQAVTLKNGGTTTVTLKSITITGTNATSFLDLSACGASLAESASCTVLVSFKPTAAGTLKGDLSISSSASTTAQTVPLTGTATAEPTLKLSVTSITFAATAPGATSEATMVTLTNSGTTTATIDDIVLGGADPADFEELNTCGATLAAAGTCSIYVSFKPAAADSYTGSVLIYDNAAASPQTITLSGKGD